MISYEQKLARQTTDAMLAAQSGLASQGNKPSSWCIERALEELDTAAAAEIARMFERNRKLSA